MKYKILAIVVSLNRPQLLKRCVEKLKNQKFNSSIDLEILIIDNGSEIELQNWIKHSGINFIFQKNTGSAGGFYRGLKESTGKGYDFFWLMDDDGYPEEYCLNYLVNCSTSNSDISIFSPNLLDETNDSHFNELFLNTDLENINHIGGPWNGILVKTEVIDKVGFPNTNFFIWGEEYEFFNRVKNYGFLYILVSSAKFIHKKTGFNLKNCPRPFFLIRNLFWIYRLNNFNSQFESRYKFLFRGVILSTKLIFFGLISFNFNQMIKTIKGIYIGLFTKISNEGFIN